MPALDYITIKGFRSIASVERLPLRPINVVIGPNGSGKSNLIQAFTFLIAIREGRLQEYVLKAGGADKILHFGSKVTEAIHLHVSFDEEVNQYAITLVPIDGDELAPFSERAYYWGDKTKYAAPYDDALSRLGKEAGISGSDLKRVPANVREKLGSWRLYHFHDTSASSPMKKTGDVNDNRQLRPDGSNLAAFLYFLRHRHADSYGLIRRTVQRVAPFFDDFQLGPSNLNPDKIRLEWRHKGSDAYFDGASLSDGTLRFIALATLFLQPEALRPSVILVDEPELGLHPYAITLLASLIKQASAKTQVIAATQSSLLLDHFGPEDVIVAEREGGGTVFRRLDPAALEPWLKSYSLGQLWEKNEIGGRPKAEGPRKP